MSAFADRAAAGTRLAEHLTHLRGQDVVVLGLPRGGVPVAFQVARALGAPLDVIVVRKLGVPFQPELAMGAVGEGDVLVLNDRVVAMTRVSRDEVATVRRRAQAELQQRTRRLREQRPRLPLTGRTALIVDDGIATGSTARAACQVARAQGAARVVLAVPVGSPEAVAELRQEVDELVCLETPRWFLAVGQAYRDFSATSDEEVLDLLARATAAAPVPADDRGRDAPLRDDDVQVPLDGLRLAGHLTVPERAGGVVVFAHGSGSSRHSPRNRHVAAVLNRSGLATLLFDLLTEDEELHRANVFDIALLAGRLAAVAGWLRTEPGCQGLPVGYFGASTGAAAALWAAAEPGAEIAAVVSRGGRPDLAGGRLAKVRAPTLLIVGGHDQVVLELNRQAQAWLRCVSTLAVVPGATHLFDEPGTLDKAAVLARDWFADHLVSPYQHTV